ncbi:MAG: alanine/ornithine racemase family PLP-dependent enzyme [Chlorobi bacterium]|nr:alanine/ornithine racemase family PLP-dependent enzyme [Chlorobiota bacterium]
MVDMITPRIEISLEKIAHNAKRLKELYASKGIDVIGVTKVVCGDTKVANALIKSGINILADSRIANIKKMVDAGIRAQFLLLRTIYSQAKDVVSYAGISLNSELSVIKELSKYAVKQDATHKIILMVELGDLREGIMPSELEKTVNEVIGLKGIELAGIGTNLACFGGIKPDDKKMGYLSSIAQNIEDKFKLKLEFVSGGNSANYDWFMSTKDVGEINNLRLGESIFLGCETLERKPIPGLFTNAFTLIVEVIESKIKPSLPYGDVYQDAFGNTPKFLDHGLIRRAILGVGLQDVLVSGLTPMLDIDILGASSDHIIIDAKQTDLRVGNTVEFKLNYGALLSAMTSPYINKKYN